MAARRCGVCGISYPDRLDFLTCPVHGTETVWKAWEEPDELWDWKATQLQIKLGAKLPSVALNELKELSGGYWELSGRAMPYRTWSPQDGDVFETHHPDTKGEPCDCLWEVMFPRRDGWIVRPLRVPDTP